MRFEANIGLLGDVGLFRVLSGLTSESDSGLEDFLDEILGGRKCLLSGYDQPNSSHQLCRSSMLGA